jgi:hypothetical protein
MTWSHTSGRSELQRTIGGVTGSGVCRNPCNSQQDVTSNAKMCGVTERKESTYPNVLEKHAFDAFFHPEDNIAYVRESGLLDGYEPKALSSAINRRFSSTAGPSRILTLPLRNLRFEACSHFQVPITAWEFWAASGLVRRWPPSSWRTYCPWYVQVHFNRHRRRPSNKVPGR